MARRDQGGVKSGLRPAVDGVDDPHGLHGHPGDLADEVDNVAGVAGFVCPGIGLVDEARKP